MTEPIWHLQMNRPERALLLAALRHWRDSIAQSRKSYPHLRAVNPPDSGLESLVAKIEALPEQ
jgi:hypothetical protein